MHYAVEYSVTSCLLICAFSGNSIFRFLDISFACCRPIVVHIQLIFLNHCM